MSVRKRKWTTMKGVEKEAWVADYVDNKGVRRRKAFAKKKDADAFAIKAGSEVQEGVHVADRDSVTVKKAGELWIATGEGEGLERSTIDQRRRHLKFHIEAFIGDTLVSKLSVPTVREFEDRLRREGRSQAMIKKVLVSLGGILADATERGLATRNPVRDMRQRRNGKEKRTERRLKGKLKVGVHIPTPAEVRAIISALDGHWRPLLITVIFTGMRSSELRGLRWQDVDLEGRSISITQRADEYGQIGRPKTEAGERTVPIPPMVVNTLREWRLVCPRRDTGQINTAGNPVRELHYVFPNGNGNIESHANIINRGLIPAQLKAGITVPTEKVDEDGNTIMAAKYTGLHSLRHFFASWCINRKEDGGLGLPVKSVQERLGHSSVQMTLDVYGHLFPRGDDADELAAAERALLS
ncbi:site-specific integrase [Sinorhizobium meliloti]|uniref:tyrosine-type recombinase/integrase n=1 Tax=Rhizobium meliloti TaxID=382 RepID=UPI0002A56D9E|nr:site-specific integrase [Sinorhizobium meliloti]AGA07732.1 Site-specific recombinase XerD [Sinorhizobium meliloti GR4]RVL03178.1 site-specific integrase [Sinorhizobium meliloti]RVM94485.1 site-specific integrase [Sinorhizobium meliloti]RVN11306.1 site-specific integrase [Sinorhizobium meliloti]